MKRRFFGTDGVRGPVGGPLINPDFARRLGGAAARFFGQSYDGPRPGLVVIGRDTRASGVGLEAAVAAGVRAEGFTVVTVGVAPTPVVSFAVRRFSAAFGVVITASHNPATDNGIKFFGPSGAKLRDEEELTIESLLDSDGPPSTAGDSPSPERLEAVDLYADHLVGLLPPQILKGWRIAVDCAHGASVSTTPDVLRRLGAEVAAIGVEPDGSNINDGVGSQHPEGLAALVIRERANLGVAHDGDADRLVLVDETGSVLDGDELMAIVARQALAKGNLRHGTLVATVQSNLGLKVALEGWGGHLVQTSVGDRYVLESMLEGGFSIGGESSGHMIFLDISPSGDGLAAALKAIEAMIETGQPLSRLRTCLKRFPQLVRALTVETKPPLESLDGLARAIADGERILGGSGRILLRYSGTEPKIRLLVEGPDPARADAVMASLERAVRNELTVRD
ncbi:MAG: phosphoglucosamine mutase [Opitutaceae bacterium]